MIATVLLAAKSDPRLAMLLDEAREFAQVYLLAKQWHKGCAGTGELMTLNEEFKDVIDKMVWYCKEKEYLSGTCDYDPDSCADILMRMPLENPGTENETADRCLKHREIT